MQRFIWVKRAVFFALYLVGTLESKVSTLYKGGIFLKKRLLAMALATTMLVTSFNVVYAQDADVATGETTVESSDCLLYTSRCV